MTTWTDDEAGGTVWSEDEAAGTALGAATGASLVGFIQSGSGAIARTVQAKERDIVSIKDFGATGDGTTVDRSAINLTFTALNAAGGGFARAPLGIFLVDTQVLPLSNTYLISDGATFKMAAAAAAGPNINVIRFDGVTNSGILGHLKIDGNRANQTNVWNDGHAGVRISGASEDIYLQSVFATGMSMDGLYIGLNGTAPKGIQIGRYIAADCYRNGGSVTNVDGLTIDYFEGRDTNGSGGPQAGFDLETNAAANSCRNVHIKHLVTYGNQLNGSQFIGIRDGTTLPHGNVTIDRHDSYDNGDAGVFLREISNVSILSGNIFENSEDGVEIARDVQHLKIINTNIHTNGSRGINGALTSQNVQSFDWNFSGCVVRNNGQDAPNTVDGIRLDSDDAGNFLTRVRMNGVELYDDQASKTQRYGFSTGSNVSDVRVRDSYIPVNATDDYVMNAVNSCVEDGLIRSSAPPTTGTWEVSDLNVRSNFAPGRFTHDACVTAGTPGTWIGFAAIPLSDPTAIGNVGTGEDDLIAETIPANVLNVFGGYVRITAWGTKANNADTKTLKLYFGSTAILTHALGTSAAGVWKIEAIVVRTGASTQKYVAVMTGTDEDQESGTSAQTETAGIIVKCTGEATSNNDILCEHLSIVPMR